jgi:hypothetical protein
MQVRNSDIFLQGYNSRRKFAVRIVFFIFILSLIEGPLRKWFLPQLSGPLTLLRDPFTVGLYAYCIANGLMLRRGIAAIWLSFSAATALVGLLQYAAQGFPVWTWLLGIRTYWLYMPLAFVVAKTFTRDDVHHLLKLNLWVAIPYALLVSIQYNAPESIFLNRGLSGDIDSAVGVSGSILRPFGIFTFTSQNVLFTAFLIAVYISFYVGQVPMKGRGLFLLVSGLAVGIMSVLTGSRLIIFLASGIVGLTIIGMLITRPTKKNLGRILGVLGFAGLSAVLILYAFSDMFQAMSDRFEDAARSEGSIWTRVLNEFTPWIDALFTSSFIGGGIGAGSSTMSSILGLPYMVYGEGDLQRNVHELGLLLGICMLMLRLGTSVWVLLLALNLAREKCLLALPFAALFSSQLLVGAITNSPLNAYLVWLSLGVILSLKVRKHEHKD